jgi:MFS family permease
MARSDTGISERPARTRVFESLRFRDFRLLWFGALVSNLGTWMQSAALTWFVLVGTGSATAASVVYLAAFLPLVLSPVGGILADRASRRRILLAMQAAMMVVATALAILVTWGHAMATTVTVLMLVIGFATAVNSPSWQSLVPTLVPASSMVNAVALNSAQFNLARTGGPALAGVLIAAIGVGSVLWINAASFLAVLTALALVRVPVGARRRGHPDGEGSRSAFRAAMRRPPVRSMLVAAGAVSFAAGPVPALLSVFARQVFDRGPGAFGLLSAAFGAGTFAGAMALARMTRMGPARVALGMAATGVSLVALATLPFFPAAVAASAVVGGAYVFTMSGRTA